MSVPDVSIVLPTFNGARWLASSIESCLSQEGPALELIVVDDASTDDTPRIAAAAAARDARVVFVRSEVNRKLPGALNTGFARARGRLLTWTSDDNLYRASALGRMTTALDSHPEIDVVYADYTLFDEAGAETEAREAGDLRHLGYSNIVGPCFLYRAKVHESLSGYAEDCFLAEDYDFWLRASAKFRFLRLREDLYLYRVHAGALASSRRSDVQTMVEQVLLRNLPALPRSMRAGAHARLRDLARARGDAAAARHHAWALFRHAPIAALKSLKASDRHP